MKSSKTYLLVILACTTLGGAALAWKQYQELIQLRAAALGADERGDLQKRLWAAEKRAKDIADQLAALRQRGGPDGTLADVESVDAENPARADRRNRGPGGPGGFGNVLNALQKPETQRLVAIQQKAALDARYAALFKNLNLSPAQLEKFKNLLVERQSAPMDVMAASAGQNLSREEVRKLVTSSQAEVDGTIKAAIGDIAFAQYQNFDQTAPQRATADQLSQRLSYSATPLTADQSAAMLQILTQTSAPRTAAIGTGGAATATVVVDGGGRGGGMTFMAGMGGGGGGPTQGTPITDATVNMAQGVLSGPQVDALKQLQAEQKAQAQLAQTFRQTMGANGGTTDAAATTTTTTKKKKDE